MNHHLIPGRKKIFLFHRLAAFGTHPVSYSMGTKISSLAVKQP